MAAENTDGPHAPDSEERPVWGIALLARRVRKLFEATGLKRRRSSDGGLESRRWDRLAFTAGAAIALYVLTTTVQVVAPGTVGVPVTFGRTGEQLQPGIHLTVPFTRITEISTRTSQYTMSATKGEGDRSGADDSVDVLGRDGAAGRVDSTVLYTIDPKRAVDVYLGVGTDYLLKVVRPSARTCIRSEFTGFDMVEAVTSSWSELEGLVSQCMTEKLEPYGLLLEDFQLREVDLADQVQSAIDAKVAAQQDAERQVFELSKARQAAEITRVEAMATADGQQILACGGEIDTVERDGKQVEAIIPKSVERCSQAQLTPQYLQYFYIQALKELVDSPNNSTIILPMDQELTPLLNVPSGTPPAVVPQATAPSATGPSSTAPTTTAPATSEPKKPKK